MNLTPATAAVLVVAALLAAHALGLDAALGSLLSGRGRGRAPLPPETLDLDRVPTSELIDHLVARIARERAAAEAAAKSAAMLDAIRAAHEAPAKKP